MLGMKRVFPFGRGNRASRQRLVILYGDRGWNIRVYEFSIRILRTHAPDLTVLMIGKSESRVFFALQIREALKSGVQAIKDFRTIRRANKIKIDKPSPKEYNAAHGTITELRQC